MWYWRGSIWWLCQALLAQSSDWAPPTSHATDFTHLSKLLHLLMMSHYVAARSSSTGRLVSPPLDWLFFRFDCNDLNHRKDLAEAQYFHLQHHRKLLQRSLQTYLRTASLSSYAQNFLYGSDRYEFTSYYSRGWFPSSYSYHFHLYVQHLVQENGKCASSATECTHHSQTCIDNSSVAAKFYYEALQLWNQLTAICHKRRPRLHSWQWAVSCY